MLRSDSAYIKDPIFNLYRRERFDGIAYSDGRQVESRLLDIVAAADRSTFSTDLPNQITDWASEYHLSRERHCLVRPLGIRAGAKVLEFGCGCGAITRYLGELGAEVIGIEGSVERARIAAERCRDLENVTIIAEDLLQFQSAKRFDWVLLIGVLEYAPVFATSANPIDDYLTHVTSFLSERGRIVLAIENKLGVKYFNGCGEDHLGQPFLGLQDLYGPQTPRTFGKKELERHLRNAGLSDLEFLYPFPDYKLPQVILSDAGLNTPSFNAADLLANIYSRDYRGNQYRLFSESLVLREAYKNAILADLSNSYLISAGSCPVDRKSEDELLAAIYSVRRSPEFATETRIVRSAENIRVVKRRMLGGLPSIRRRENLTLRQVAEDSDYVSGSLMAWDIVETRARSGEIEPIVDAFEPWFDYLLRLSKREAVDGKGSESPDSLGRYYLEGSQIDLTPSNLIKVGPDIVSVDHEWRVDGPVPLGWVLARGCLYSAVLAPGFRCGTLNTADIVFKLCGRRNLRVSQQEISEWLDLERILQSIVSGTDSPALHGNMTWPRNVPLHRLVAELQSARRSMGSSALQRAKRLWRRATRRTRGAGFEAR